MRRSARPQAATREGLSGLARASTGQRLDRQLELPGADPQEGHVVVDRVPDLGVAHGPEREPLRQVAQRRVVVLPPELREAEQRPRRSRVRLELDEAREGPRRLHALAPLVGERPEVPPALVPGRPEPHRLPVPADGLLGPSFARCSGLLRRPPGRSSSRRREKRRAVASAPTGQARPRKRRGRRSRPRAWVGWGSRPRPLDYRTPSPRRDTNPPRQRKRRAPPVATPARSGRLAVSPRRCSAARAARCAGRTCCPR